ncbi:MAG: histidine kinase dimerization/phospho-acceptor domain-containing protein, partial [Acidobacteriota bacterium]|nr:histidine kinase dimerization/phospho-acceptor domain-containing protein [Acidobacteriota bacterium]
MWEDIGLGVAAFALCLALTAGLGLWLSYVTGALFTLGVAILAWRHGFRPALVTAILATAAIGPLTAALDVRADAVSLTVRVVSVGVVSLAIAWLCGNLYRSREQLLVEQSRLRESEGFHRLIGELASDFAFHARIEPGGHIVIDSATSGLHALLGYTLEELQRRPGLALIHPEDRDALQSALARAGAGADVHGEARVIAKDGHLVYVEYSAHPERREDGMLSGVLGAFRDVTVQREQQVSLAEERQRLLVDIKMRQQVEGQLRLAKDEAERRANEAEEARAALRDRERRLQYEAQLKDEFLATLAHELRNPLAPIRTALDLLKLAPADSDVATAAREVMERQVTQVVRLIDDLLDLSRVSRGLIELRKARVPLARLLE